MLEGGEPMIHQIANSGGNYSYNACIYEDVDCPSHFHNNFELIYGITGSPHIYLDQQEYTLQAGELLLIPPNTVHAFRIGKQEAAWVGVFSADHIALFAKHHANKQFSPFRCGDSVHEYLKAVFFYRGTPERYLLKSALYAVCSECVKNATVLLEKERTDILNAILDHIAQKYHMPITMRTMAEELGYEYHYFSCVFHKCIAANFKAFLNMYRYEKACELLAHTDGSITEIAMRSGFQSLRSFNEVFKALSGMTPTEYRQSLR